MRSGPRVHETTAEISLQEAYRGTTRRLKLGHGAESQLEFDVDIPAGIKRWGQDPDKAEDRPGTADRRENPAGLLASNVRGDNLRVRVPVPLLDAVLGGEVEVPTLTGKVALTIPAGTQNGSALRIRGKGMPKTQSGDSFGDIVAVVDVRLPEELTAEELELFALTPAR